MKNKSPNLHVVKLPSQGWGVKEEKNPTPIAIKRTQSEAEAVAKAIARTTKVEVFTHGTDGRIRDRDSFGNDPHPPDDKRH